MFLKQVSTEDQSVNFLSENGSKEQGMLEARFVRRTPDYFIAYLSSQFGCKQACRFCHLTATGQTAEEQTTLEQYLSQADEVLRYHAGLRERSPLVHFNFMARGEPLENALVRDDFCNLQARLTEKASDYGLESKLKVSSIIPAGAKELMPLLEGNSELYYSLYTVNPKFRARWIPKGLSPDEVGKRLRGTRQGLVLHHAFIAGENDSPDDIQGIHEWLEKYDIHARFNTVRYNPFSERQGRETDCQTVLALDTLMRQSPNITGGRVVPRVGFDVKASCGMFVEA